MEVGQKSKKDEWIGNRAMQKAMDVIKYDDDDDADQTTNKGKRKGKGKKGKG